MQLHTCFTPHLGGTTKQKQTEKSHFAISLSKNHVLHLLNNDMRFEHLQSAWQRPPCGQKHPEQPWSSFCLACDAWPKSSSGNQMRQNSQLEEMNQEAARKVKTTICIGLFQTTHIHKGQKSTPYATAHIQLIQAQCLSGSTHASCNCTHSHKTSPIPHATAHLHVIQDSCLK